MSVFAFDNLTEEQRERLLSNLKRVDGLERNTVTDFKSITKVSMKAFYPVDYKSFDDYIQDHKEFLDKFEQGEFKSAKWVGYDGANNFAHYLLYS